MQRSFILLALVAMHASAAQEITVPAARLSSSSDTARAHAFYDMVKAASIGQPPNPHMRGPRTDLLAARARNQDDLRESLISLLGRENQIVSAAPTKGLPTGYDVEGYYVDLLVTVARTHDPRAIGVLAPGIGISGPVQNAMADFGAAAVPDLIAEFGSGDRAVRASAARVLGVIAGRRAVTPLGATTLDSIRTALLSVAGSSDDAFVRQTSVVALGSFSDEGVRTAMTRLAASDTAVRTSPGNVIGYPVRTAARNWLVAHARSY